MTVLVTGGAGFIGSNYIYFHRKAYPTDRIVCLDKLTYAGNLSTLGEMLEDQNFRFVRGDICDQEGVFRLFAEERPETVVNFAAESHVDRSILRPDVFLQTNVLGTGVLLDACRQYHTARFHQVSTDEVYGDLPLDRPDLTFSEQSPLRASSPYSASKAGADLLVLAYHRTYGLPVTISRSGNNYGPYQFPEKLIPLMLINCLEDKSLPVYGAGNQVRDWLHVADHCRAIDLVLRRGKAGEVYNIGGQEKQNIQIVRQICRELGKPEGLITHVEDRKGHDLRYAVDFSKITRDLGWRPEIRFENGLSRTIAWYLDHRAWWQEIILGEYQTYYQRMYGQPGRGAELSRGFPGKNFGFEKK